MNYESRINRQELDAYQKYNHESAEVQDIMALQARVDEIVVILCEIEKIIGLKFDDAQN